MRAASGLWMTPGARVSVVVLFVLSLALSGVAYLAAVHNYQASQASQRRQGEVLEQRLCTTLDGLAGLTPPSGATSDNPSRLYLAQLHAKLAELGPDVGCPTRSH